MLEGGAAQAAGVEPGDVIESIDGRPATDLDLYELRELLKADVEGWALTVRRGEARIEARLTAKSII